MTTIYNFISVKKLSLLTIILSLLFINGWCQAPTIGQSAGAVKALIDYEVSSYYRSQGYHQVRMDHRTDYKNGQISEVIICKKNVPMIDLQKAGNFCTHYIMGKGKLIYIAIQYSNISIDELETVMRKSSIQVGNYYFGDDNQTYSMVYLSRSRQATKEIHDMDLEPVPITIKNQLATIRAKKEEAINDQPFEVTNAIDYDGFVKQEDKILYTYMDGMALKQKVNLKFVKKANSPLKAVLGYYTAISNSYKLTEDLGLGDMCSDQFLRYIAKYFISNSEIMSQIPQCNTRALSGAYSLNRLEFSVNDGIVTASYSMTYYENHSSKNDVIGVDKFRINNDNTISILKLSSKTDPVVKNKEEDFVATSVEVQPHFKGGNEAFAKFLSDNISYPVEAKKNKIEGRVWLSFVIDENGSVTKAKILRELGGGCDEEALRVIKLSPKWEPGMTNNHPVKCQYTVPISFSL